MAANTAEGLLLLDWIDEQIGDLPYGVDIVIPNKYEGMDASDLDPDVLKKTLNDLVPQEHIDFVTSPSEYGDRYGEQGQASGRMPYFSQILTPEQIEAVVEYERELAEARREGDNGQ